MAPPLPPSLSPPADSHPVRCLHNLGVVQWRKGDRNSALRTLEAVLDARRAALGEEHKETQRALKWVQRVRRKQPPPPRVDHALWVPSTQYGPVAAAATTARGKAHARGGSGTGQGATPPSRVTWQDDQAGWEEGEEKYSPAHAGPLSASDLS